MKKELEKENKNEIKKKTKKMKRTYHSSLGASALRS